MAPSTLAHVLRELDERQDAANPEDAAGIPPCVTTCMNAGNVTGCNSIWDYACICKSPIYLDSVTTCWLDTCTPEAIEYGQHYAQSACLAFGVDLNVTATDPDMPAPSIQAYGDPVLYQKAFTNVQAIMSSVCSALFAIALVLGILACRKRVRIDRETAQRSTWTGIGGTTLGATDTKGVSRFGMSRGGVSSRGAGLDSNFDITSMSTLRYNQASSYNGFSNRDPGAPSLNRTGFTNRLTLGDMGEEEWEMSAKSSPNKESDHQLGPDSPTGSTSKIGESTVDLGEGDKRDGSTVELNSNPAPTGTGGHTGQAI